MLLWSQMGISDLQIYRLRLHSVSVCCVFFRVNLYLILAHLTLLLISIQIALALCLCFLCFLQNETEIYLISTHLTLLLKDCLSILAMRAPVAVE